MDCAYYARMDIANYIKSVREKLELTQDEFAQKIKTKRANISNYEIGRAIPPGDILLRIQELENNISDEKAA